MKNSDCLWLAIILRYVMYLDLDLVKLTALLAKGSNHRCIITAIICLWTKPQAYNKYYIITYYNYISYILSYIIILYAYGPNLSTSESCCQRFQMLYIMTLYAFSYVSGQEYEYAIPFKGQTRGSANIGKPYTI